MIEKEFEGREQFAALWSEVTGAAGLDDMLTANGWFKEGWLARAERAEQPDEFNRRLRAQLEQEWGDLQALKRAEQRTPPGWISVEVRLPESGVVVLACYTNRAGNVRRIRAQWIAAKTEEADIEWCDNGEYDEETDTYYTPQGWYERIDNWGDYSSVAVCEGEVTHWMPLPAAPGEPAPPAPQAEQREPLTWQQHAIAWLRGKAAEQAQNNERWPDHAKAYSTWRDYVTFAQRLADELEQEVGAPKTEEAQ